MDAKELHARVTAQTNRVVRRAEARGITLEGLELQYVEGEILRTLEDEDTLVRRRTGSLAFFRTDAARRRAR